MYTTAQFVFLAKLFQCILYERSLATLIRDGLRAVQFKRNLFETG